MLNTKCSNGSGSFVAAAPHEVQYKISIQELQPYNILWVNFDHETFGHILELYFDNNTQWMDKWMALCINNWLNWKNTIFIKRLTRCSTGSIKRDKRKVLAISIFRTLECNLCQNSETKIGCSSTGIFWVNSYLNQTCSGCIETTRESRFWKWPWFWILVNFHWVIKV